MVHGDCRNIGVPYLSGGTWALMRDADSDCKLAGVWHALSDQSDEADALPEALAEDMPWAKR